MTSRPLPSIQFRWLIILALGSRRSVDGCPQSREACIRLRPQIAKNFIDLREHSFDKLNDLGDCTPQLLYIPLALFAATVEIAHGPPSYPTSSWNC